MSIKAQGKHIIIKSLRRDKGFIVVRDEDIARNRKQWLYEDTTVFSAGEEVKKIKKGDKVILHNLTPIVLITERVNKALGEEQKKEDGVEEVYFAVKEEHIVAVIN